ncbi:InlB B-repeat-containing protein [Fibrobacter sp. UWB13]|uniref:InlB B-repeat-containing protein n=1 Tax=Fibrobacter sp. UWB13 TaxID=1896204 RepID=UPI000A0C085A|nr:InlB B-repeat-containing protein [Fibrobacter sp. UWB13]SMG37673.1 Listeria/Bacterioides repeat-containing protein [Fibrobacter sp. UWB13]
MERFLILALAAVAFAADPIVPSAPKLDSDGCYAISTAEELYGFADIVNASKTHDECGKLTADIYVDWESWNYTNYWVPIELFRGVFDGQNHTIENLYYSAYQFSKDSTSSVGLFGELRGFTNADGSVEKLAVVKNLGIAGNYFSGAGCNGAIAGKAHAAEITNSYQSGNVESRWVSGGLVGCASSLKISESYNKGYVSRYYEGDSTGCGGFVGRNDGDLTIVNSYNVGSASGDVAGGLVGTSLGKLSIYNSFSYIERGFTDNPLPLVGSYKSDDLVADNIFYLLPEFGEPIELGMALQKDDFRFGLILEWLRNYNKNGVEGSMWGQTLGADLYPNLTGSVLVSSVGTYENPAKKLDVKYPKKADGCYQIGSAEELYGFALIANAVSYNGDYVCGKLTKDIVVNKNVLLNDTLNGDGKNFLPWIPIWNFAGDFDGAGHVLSGLYFNDGYYYIGLFGSVMNPDPEREVKIENVGVMDSYFHGASGVGAIVGLVRDSSKAVHVRNCYSSSYILGSGAGLVGHHRGDSLTLELSYNDGIVNGSLSGGLIGQTYGKTLIANSYSAAKLISSNYVGLLVGRVGYSYTQDYRLFVVNSYGIDPYAKEKSLEVRPAISSIETRLAPEFENTFTETTKKQIEKTYRTVDSVVVSNVDSELFSDGTVATLLHNYRTAGRDGLVWGQKVGSDSYPIFSGSISASVALSDLKLVTFPDDTVKYYNKYKEGIVTTLPIPVKDGDVFGGWYANADFSGEAMKAIPAEAKGPQTFYAKWIHYPLQKDGCYEIANVSELNLFRDIVDSLKTPLCAKLTDDIVLNENVLVDGKLDSSKISSFEPWFPLNNYQGVFDGNGHTISGLILSELYCHSSSHAACGFFGRIESGNLVIKNLGIVDSYVFGGNSVGGFVGAMYGKSLVIANSYFEGVVKGYEDVGGLIGYTDRTQTLVLSCFHRGPVEGAADVGGLIGLSYETKGSLTMMYSYNEGSVSATQAVGGLIGGEITDFLHLSNSYNVATVSSSKKGGIGGLVGYLKNDSTLVYNSYNMGNVSGSDSIGGICGFKKNYVDLHLDGAYYLEGLPEGLGGTAVAAEDFANKNLLKRLQSYRDHGLDGSVWTQSDSDKYPVLNKSVSDKFIDSLLAVVTAPRSSSSSSVSSSSSSSSAVDVSSSSEPKSSSSYSEMVKSSSSSVKSSSSSSVPKSSSSSVKSSSSSEKVKSSSSSVKSSSSSNKSKSSSSSVKSSSSGKVSIASAFVASPIAIRTQGRMVEISGLQMGESYALMDLQGRLLQRGYANGSTVMLQVTQSGRYLLRVAGRNRIVNVR